MHLNCIVHAIDVGQHVFLGDKGGIYPQLDLTTGEICYGQRLYGVSKLLGIAEILRLQGRYSLTEHILMAEPATIGQCRQDSELVGRIDTLNVVCGVGLGVPQSLCFGKGIGEGASGRRPFA